MSGHILKCLAEINFTSAIEQTYDWTNYFKHKIIFCKIFPITPLFISDDPLNILFLLIYINNEKSTLCKAHLSKQ